MTFQYPQALYLFLLIPLLIIFYFIKTKKVEHYYTPAYFLWVKVAQQSSTKTVWQQLLRNLVLLLQVLITTALILALAKPRFVGELDLEQPVVLVVDNSAGMSTREGETTRLEQAKAQALKLIDDLGNRQIMLVSTVRGDENAPLFTDNRAQLARYINNIPATDGSDDFPHLIPYLVARSQKPPQIYIISDAAGFDMGQLLEDYENLFLIKIGEETDNLAIVGLEARRNPLARQRYQIMIRARNYGVRSRRVTIETSFEDVMLDTKEVELPAGEQTTIIVAGDGGTGGTIRSRMVVDDALEVDNQAYTILRPRRDIKLLMVNVKNKHLLRALGILDRVRIIPMSKNEYQQLIEIRPYTRFDVGVFYGFSPQAFLSWHNLVIDPEEGPSVPVNTHVSWNQNHPIMKYLELSRVRVKRANSLKLDPQSQVLLQAGETPLLVYDAWQRFDLFRLGFALEDSDFYLRPAFPMFLFNVLDFFSSQITPRDLVKLEVGQPYIIPVLPEQLKQDRTGHIITPLGDKIPIKLYKGEENNYRPLWAGKYKFILDGFSSTFVVSQAEAESHIMPYKAAASRVILAKTWRVWGGYIKFWHIWAALALGLVVFEWWYHREKVDALY